jgi:cell division septation protein DedD
MRPFAFIFFAVGALDAWALLDARAVQRRSNRRLSTANFVQLKITASDAAAYDGFGNPVAIDGNTVVISAAGGGADGTSAGVYVLRTSDGGATYVEVAKLTSPDVTASDLFGWSVAIDGDTIVVGAYGDDSFTGAAYVFRTTDGGVTYPQVDKLMASDGAANDAFGGFVAIDGATIVIGATGASTGGAVYVFRTSDGGATYGQAVKLTASDAASGDSFGNSVAVDGDTVVVGAYFDDDGGFNSGSAYVFRTPDGGVTYTQVDKLTAASDGAENDYFSISVAIDGNAIVVGSYGAGTGGAVYVFRMSDGGGATYDQMIKLTADDAAQYDSFGVSVAIDGDTIVVGASQLISGPGKACIFQTDDGGATYDQVAKLTADDGAQYDSFGISVAIDGDTIVVGANRDNDSGTYSGSAYVFSPPAPTAQPTPQPTPQPTHSPKPTTPRPTPKPTTPQPTPQPTTPRPTPQPTPEPSTGALGSDSATRAGGTLLALVVTVLAL